MDDFVQEMKDMVHFYYVHKTEPLPEEPLMPGTDLGAARLLRSGSKIFLLPYTVFSQGAIETERAHGLTNIAGHYRLPQGLRPVDLQCYVQVLDHAQERGDITAEIYRDKLLETHAVLLRHNPVLAKLKIDWQKAAKIYDVLLGVASGFHIRDIQNYVDGGAGSQMQQDPDWRRKFNDVAAVVGALRWVPSAETLDIMRDQLYKKRQPKPPAHMMQGYGFYL